MLQWLIQKCSSLMESCLLKSLFRYYYKVLFEILNLNLIEIPKLFYYFLRFVNLLIIFIFKLLHKFKDMSKISLIFLLFVLLCLTNSKWTEEKAWDWYNKFNWSAGVNYVPAYAVNQIQMWESFDIEAIQRQIKWATDMGFSKFRTFLHIQPFINNRSDLMKKMLKYLIILNKYKSQAIFVLFDDCWNPTYKSGKQPDPIPGVHNSQWVQCPGDVKLPDSTYQDYVVTILKNFGQNQNIAFWDLYNQVGNSDHFAASLPLLKKIFTWARSVNPLQPLTSGKWNGGEKFTTINEYIMNESDIITFHAYCDVDCTQDWIKDMKQHNRPVICTEYMARWVDSKFITHLPIFKSENIWAINWGFVFGRTQTYYPWGSQQGTPVPEIWFHDVVHPNGTSYDPTETAFIKNITTL